MTPFLLPLVLSWARLGSMGLLNDGAAVHAGFHYESETLLRKNAGSLN
jgi:hypothetical protein